MSRCILHIDFNSYFATIEQQANPRLRGKPIGVTGGDRLERTVLGAASIEAKQYGVKTGMHFYEAKRLCPQLILVKGDSDKYLECSKRFLNILKNYSPWVEVFSIDESFVELKQTSFEQAVEIAEKIKQQIFKKVGEWVTCSIGISYNKLIAKLASSLYKPNGLVVVTDPIAAEYILDNIELDEICGIGSRIKKRLNNMGIFSFKELRKLEKANLVASFKSHMGESLYNMARGLDYTPVVPFFEKSEVKSIGHRHTLGADTDDSLKIKQVLLKLTELVARRLRAKRLVARTVTCYFRDAVKIDKIIVGDGMQVTIPFTDDGLEIFKAVWEMFNKLWLREKIRMVGVSVSQLQPKNPQTICFLEDYHKKEVITRALDKINDRYGEFALQRAVLLRSKRIRRMANSFISDRRFKLSS